MLRVIKCENLIKNNVSVVEGYNKVIKVGLNAVSKITIKYVYK